MKGSYTVEASWIMAISLSVICATILVAFGVYGQVIELVSESLYETDVVELFRHKTGLKEIMETFR